MAKKTFEEEIGGLLGEWTRSLLDGDAGAAAALREDGYTATLPNGAVLTREQELALVSSPDHRVESIDVSNVEVSGRGDEATAVFDSLIKGVFKGERIGALYKHTLSLRKTGGVWRARGSGVAFQGAPKSRPWDDAAATSNQGARRRPAPPAWPPPSGGWSRKSSSPR